MSKEEVEAEKARLKAVDARPIKKVRALTFVNPVPINENPSISRYI